MTDLSPAAQAVLNAYETAPLHHDHRMVDRLGLAAALRSAADQVAPVPLCMVTCCEGQQGVIHRRLLDIAAELEAEVDD
jgi:hypothetical protein